MDDLLSTIQSGNPQAQTVAPAAVPAAQPAAQSAFDPTKSYGTPSKLLDNLTHTESSGNAYAVNDKTGAMGPLQFTPSTLAMLRKQGVKFDPFDPQQARNAADWYIQQLKGQNGGTYEGALKAYGGFVTKDPSQYVGKVMNGVNAAQPTIPGQSNSGAQPQGYQGPMSDLFSTLQSGAQPPQQPSKPAPIPAPQQPNQQPQSGPLTAFGRSAAGLADTVLSAPGQFAQQADYAVRRAFQQNPQQAQAASQGDFGGASHPVGNLFGVTNTPEYQAEASQRAQQAIGGVVNKGVNAVANATGAAPEDVSNMAGSAALLVPGAAKGAARAVAPVARDVASTIGDVAAQTAAEDTAASGRFIPGISNGRGSVGAAGTSFEQQARAEGVAEPIVQKIAQQEQQGTLNPTAAERHIESQSLPVPVELTAGQAMGDVSLLSQEQNMRGKNPELAERFNAQNGQIAANFDAIRDRIAPDVNVPAGQALDQEIVDAYKRMDEPIRADIAAKYKALEDANGGQFPLSGQDFASAADNALNAQSKAYSRFLPGTVSGLLDDFRSGGPMTFNDFESMRTILANEARKADRAGDGNAAHAIGLVRDSLESLPMTEETAQLKPLADAARAAARQRFEALAADPAYKAAVTDGVGINEPSPAADGFFRKYVVQGKSANVQNMMRNLSSDPENGQMLSAGMIDHIRSQSGIDLRTGTGNISQAGLNKALTNLRDKPGIVMGQPVAQTLEKLGNVARYTQEQPRGSFVNNSNTFVAGAAEAAKSAAEGVANRLAFGVPVGTWARQGFAKKALNKQVRTSLEPGAGVQSPGVPLNRLIRNNTGP